MPDSDIPALAAAPKRVMIDTCAGASVFPKGFDGNAVDDYSVPPISLVTATGKGVQSSEGKRSTFALKGGRAVSL